jgi:hypothetical protein
LYFWKPLDGNGVVVPGGTMSADVEADSEADLHGNGVVVPGGTMSAGVGAGVEADVEADVDVELLFDAQALRANRAAAAKTQANAIRRWNGESTCETSVIPTAPYPPTNSGYGPPRRYITDDIVRTGQNRTANAGADGGSEAV